MWFHLADVRTAWEARDYIQGSIYIDTGNGFSEEQKLPAVGRLINGRFSINVSLKKYHGIKELRWDPTEGSPCICKIDEDCRKRLQLLPVNGKTEDRGDVFITTDPIYQIPIKGEAPRELMISGEFRKLAMEEVIELSREQQSSRGIRFWRK